MSGSPSASVNTYVSATRNTYLLSSISLACFTAAETKNIPALTPCAFVVLILAIVNGCTSVAMFERFVRRVRATEDMVTHPATDFHSWGMYVVQLKAYLCVLVLALVAMILFKVFGR